MSRIGKNPVQISPGVEVTVTDTQTGQLVKVKGPKGELESKFRSEINIQKEDGKIILTRKSDEDLIKSLHGLTRSLISNMILGVTQGYKRELDIIGTGYRAQLQGTKLILQVGYSHQVEVESPTKETKIEIDKNQTHITITGISKQVVGDLAPHSRSIKLPEPYKGKGIKYMDEKIRRKVGKSAAKK